MGGRGWKLIASDKSSVFAKSFFDQLVVEGGEGDRCFPDPSRANESDGFQICRKFNNLPDQFIAPKTGPRRRGR
jgi:hypothetical protein